MNLTKQILLAALNECQAIGGDKSRINTDTFITESRYTSATAGVVVDSELRTIWVAFKGSKEFKDFIYDAKFKRQVVRFNTVDRPVKAHSGFWEQMLSIKDGLDSILRITLERHPDYQVIFTGHSLGGGIGACYIVASNYSRKCDAFITFGSPAQGNKEFKKYVLSKVPHTFRVFNEKDLVPKLLSPFGDRYQHIGYEVELKDKRRSGVEAGNTAAAMVNHDTVIDYEVPIQAIPCGLHDTIETAV